MLKMFTVISASVIITLLTLRVSDSLLARERFVKLCQSSAGTVIFDENTLSRTRLEALICTGGDTKKRCRSTNYSKGRELPGKHTALGLWLDRRSVPISVGVDYSISVIGNGKYLLTTDFRGPEPGIAGMIGDLIPIGERSNLSCYDI